MKIRVDPRADRGVTLEDPTVFSSLSLEVEGTEGRVDLDGILRGAGIGAVDQDVCWILVPWLRQQVLAVDPASAAPFEQMLQLAASHEWLRPDDSVRTHVVWLGRTDR